MLDGFFSNVSVGKSWSFGILILKLFLVLEILWIVEYSFEISDFSNVFFCCNEKFPFSNCQAKELHNNNHINEKWIAGVALLIFQAFYRVSSQGLEAPSFLLSSCLSLRFQDFYYKYIPPWNVPFG